MFVPYASYDEAFRIFKEVFGGFNSPYKKELEENLEKLNISKKTEKKCRKKLRLSADANILEFLKKKVLCAERVTDEGQSWDASSGRYLSVYCGDLIIYIVTKKWEIFSVSFQK